MIILHVQCVVSVRSYQGVPGEQVNRAEVTRRGRSEREHGGEGRGEEGGSSLRDRRTQTDRQLAEH